MNRRNDFAPGRYRRIGAMSTNQGIQLASTGAAVGASAIAAGAEAGSLAGPIGTAVGAAVGVLASVLVHKSSFNPQVTAAIVNALNGISTANHQGQAIPWSGSNSAPGLEQFLQSLMSAGIWMGWDKSVLGAANAVNGNWANTFITALKQVVQTILSNPVGQQVCVSITDRPGGNDAVPGQFCFVNPGIGVGPDVISAKIIMGNGGLMYWMILRTGETTAHASMNGNNVSAQKVFALMVDHAAYDFAPQPPPATIATVANAPPPPPPPVATIQPLPIQTIAPPAPLPVTAPLPIQAQPAAAPIIIQTPSGPVAAPAPVSSGLSTTAILMIAAVGVAAVVLSQRN
jgi:hypothetical protein